MPIYEYECLNCRERFELLVRSADESAVCVKCNSKSLKKLISTFAFASKDKSGNVNASSGGGCSSCAGGDCSVCGG